MASKKIGLLTGAALILAAGALPVLAQPAPNAGAAPPPPPARGFAVGEAFARADANNDGRVTLEEGRAWLAARFQEVDANRDGGVSLEEFTAYAQARMGGRTPPPQAQQHGAAMFRAVDANGDGRVTLQEITPFAEAMFRARDANGDGALSREEVRPEHRGPRHHHAGPGPEGRRGPPPAPPAQPN